MSQKFLFTCEHGGNNVPSEYLYLFSGKEDIIYSHKSIDLGALRLAKSLSSRTGIELIYTTISRLLVEANRSPDDEELFSEYVKDEPEEVKEEIQKKYFRPHRKEVEDKINELITGGSQVVHVAIHTFAPVVDGEVRATDVGILFDPERKQELSYAEKLKTEILKINGKLLVNFNSPYPGTEDCFPAWLRKMHPENQYLGFEIEVNQKHFLDGEPEVWEKLVKEITQAMKAASADEQ